MTKFNFPEAIKASGTDDNEVIFFAFEEITKKGEKVYQIMVATSSGVKPVEDISIIPEDTKLPVYSRLMTSFLSKNKLISRKKVATN